jgi:Flp pilus assembly protein TadB
MIPLSLPTDGNSYARGESRSPIPFIPILIGLFLIMVIIIALAGAKRRYDRMQNRHSRKDKKIDNRHTRKSTARSARQARKACSKQCPGIFRPKKRRECMQSCLPDMTARFLAGHGVANVEDDGA